MREIQDTEYTDPMTATTYAILTGGGLLVAGFLLWWVVGPLIRPLSHRERKGQPMTTLTPKRDILTGAHYRCTYCRRVITEVQDPYSFVIDYGDDGDFGCDDHPLNNDEGTYGHVPDISEGQLRAGDCRYCDRFIIQVDGIWIDPDATGDDWIWRETCDEHDTFEADHEPND